MKMNDHTEKEKIVYEDEPETSEDGDLDEVEGKVKKLKEKLKKCNEDKQEYLAGWQRAQADFINYRRRQEEQIGELRKLFNEGLIIDLLSILDSVEKGMASNIKGMDVLYKQLKDVLKKQGLEEVKAMGEKFNPELHEAVEQVEADVEEGVVIEEVQKGYMLNGRVIRTSKVKVSKK